MKFQSSTLFVNTGRKALPAMQKKKKSSKNNIALTVCISIIAVLCVFVGLVAYVWASYNESNAPKETSAQTEIKEVKPKDEIPSSVVSETDKQKEEKETAEYKTSGSKTKAAKEAVKAFSNVSAEYSFGIMNLNDEKVYIHNTEKIYNSSALAPFLAEYVSNGIYYGTFDYTTNVNGYQGSYLMDKAFKEGDVECANMLISYFGSDNLNSYFTSKGYTNTYFDGGISQDGESYTTAEDLVKLMHKFYNNTTFFPYSDMYKKMLSNTIDDKIMKSLPNGAYGANMSFSSGDEAVDAAIIYTDAGNFIFVSTAEGDEEELAAAYQAMATSAKNICKSLKK